MKLDPYELGLKVGFEIHQQLATKNKLFCSCKCVEVEKYESEFVRRLRPTQSELGEYDPAALFEFRKGRLIKYLRTSGSSCLVEADEEPPHDVNNEALETALIIALALNSNIVDEVHVMRKIVIDGSNTTGFQRTMLIANGGAIEAPSKKVKVQSISLEEDAAKLISDDGNVRTYGLDRLGTPLIEVALEPVTGTTEEIMKVALTLGRLMRASKRVARGLGTIRQDVNISIKDGGVIEVKGVQKLDQLIKVIEYEMMRQHGLQLITKKLAERNIAASSIDGSPIDITDIFMKSTSKVIKKAIESNGAVMAVRLKGFASMLSYEPYEGIRLGRELGELVRFYGLGGVFHSDELPAYGITKEEVDAVRKILSLGDGDAFVMVAGSKENVEAAMDAIVGRVRHALQGVPAETRAATNEGKTVYSRPRPGAARMYPETDIPPIPINENRLRSLRNSVPKSWDTFVSELSTKYGLNKILAEKIFDSDYLALFEEIADGTKVAPTFVASTLTESLVGLERQGLDLTQLSRDKIWFTFEKLNKGEIAKESAVSIFEQLMKKEAASVDEAIAKLGLKAISDKQLNEILDKVVQDNAQVIAEKGSGAISILMGEAMNTLRGKVDGQKVNTLLKQKIAKIAS
ncbi:MAG TPA: Glu-tRNA(Gln) amidotransferase subunit GatE [Nitrososphaerales archaeon]|nr:Glu-tRNA(Gln) amidotransferase subunit GatE [Nitrososphaerales archaeon]